MFNKKVKNALKKIKNITLEHLKKRYKLAYFTPTILAQKNIIIKFKSSQRDTAKAFLRLANMHMVNLSDTKLDYTTWKIEPQKEVFTVPDGITFTLDSLDPLIFAETFIYDIHFVEHDLNNKTVVEGGGFVGDTALYYANKGATVYTFEPDSITFSKLKNNIKLNPALSKKIKPINAAVGKNGKLKFAAEGSGGSRALNDNKPILGNKKYIEVESYSIDRILSKYNIKKPYLLHLDIKGQEEEIITQNGISNFKRIRLEYSFYLWKNKDNANLAYLMDKLKKAGFTKIRIFKHNNLKIPLILHGTVDASK